MPRQCPPGRIFDADIILTHCLIAASFSSRRAIFIIRTPLDGKSFRLLRARRLDSRKVIYATQLGAITRGDAGLLRGAYSNYYARDDDFVRHAHAIAFDAYRKNLNIRCLRRRLE